MTASTLFLSLLLLVNCISLSIILYQLCNWLGRVERKLDNIADLLIAAKTRVDGMYLRMLCDWYKKLVASGQHDEAKKIKEEINRIINEEEQNQ